MASVGITENVKGDSRKFEIWYNAREEVYIIQVGQGRGQGGAGHHLGGPGRGSSRQAGPHEGQQRDDS